MTTPPVPLRPDGDPVDTAGLRIHDLGTLVVEVAGAHTTFGNTKPGLVLAVLLVNANRRVSVDALVDAVWGEVDPQSVQATLESHIWRLRKTFEPHRGRRQQPLYLVNDAGGYRLIVNPDNVDSLRFAQLAEQGDRLLATGESDRALDRYELALRLWRGRPFEAVADDEWATAAVARLNELHGQLQEQRIETLLRLGAVERAIASLEELVVRLPYQERLWGRLMLGLYQAGRVEEALDTYRRARSEIVDSLGLEPGDALRNLHARILDQDPTLLPETSPATSRRSSGDQSGAPRTAATHGIHLPTRLSPLVGRELEVAGLTALLDRARLVTLVGSAGCGKTRLSLEVARRTVSLAPDGIWFVDLTAIDDPSTVMETIASVINLEQPPLGGVARALSSYTADRQILLVLDNCEHVLAGVYEALEALLADDSQCRIIATSREPIGFDGETLWTLAPLPVREDATLPSTGPSPAADLFITRARGAAPEFSTAETELDQIEAICSAVDGIPLAIELAAGRLRSASLPEVYQQVTTELAGLSGAGYAKTEHHRTVEAAVDWSVQRLPAAERALHSVLSQLPGLFTQEAAHAVTGDASRRQVNDLITGLVHRSLLTVVPPDRPGHATRFRQLATVRAHAAEALAEAGRTVATRERRQSFIHALVNARPSAGSEDSHGWHAQIEANHDTLAAVLHHSLVDQPTPQGVRLAAWLAEYWFYRGRVADGARWLEAALRQPDASPTDRALVELTLAYIYALRDRTDLSVTMVRRALDVSRPADHADLRAYAYGLVAAAWCMSVRQDPALEYLDDEVRRLSTDDPTIALWADTLTTNNRLYVDGPTVTSARAAELVTRARTLDCVSAAWLASWLDVLCAFLTRQAEAGRARLRQVNELYDRLGGGPAANAVEFEADFAAMAGDPSGAARLFGKASRLAFQAGLGWPVAPVTQDVVRQVKDALPVEHFNAAWQAGDIEARSIA